MAPRRYALSGNQNAGASVTIMTISGTTAVRPAVYYITQGFSATPADNAVNMQVNRHTNDGTGTATTPQALDSGDPAASGTGVVNHSIEPTYTANAIMLSYSVNTRANYQFYSNPGGEFIGPATALSGFGIRFVVVSGGTQLSECSIAYSE